MMTPNELRALLEGAMDRAAVLSRPELEREFVAMFENLTLTQVRCTELIQFSRSQARELEARK